MTTAHRILWGEGMFLRPQHFQQQAHYLDNRLTHCLGRIHQHPWGLGRLDLDEEALKAGLLRIERLEATFQDGTLVQAPMGDPLPPPRSLDTIPDLGVDGIVHVCLPTLQPHGGNCSHPEAPGGGRFLTAHVQATDLYTRALESEISVMQANTRLMLDSEDRDGLLSLPVLRIQRSPAGTWSQDPRFVPPVTQVGAAPPLVQMVRRLLEICQVKSQAMAATHREQAHSVMEYGTSDVASFWLLHTVNRTWPLLAHALQHPGLHPETLYLTLAQMAAELLTFSSTLALSDIPGYNHGSLTTTFDHLDELIRTLLETVISTRYVVIPLESPRAGFLTGRLEDRLLEQADFYLSVTSETAATQILDAIPQKLKVGCPDDVEKILHSALPGIRLVHTPQTPPAIPVRIGNHYFALEKQSAIYQNMVKSRSITIYKPQSLPDMKLELFAVLH